MSVSYEQDRIELEVRDFGPIIEATIDLRPLTVFVGPSNTGKPCLATLIYALHRGFSGAAGTDYRRSSQAVRTSPRIRRERHSPGRGRPRNTRGCAGKSKGETVKCRFMGAANESGCSYAVTS